MANIPWYICTIPSFLKTFFLEYSFFTVWYYFLLYSKVNQLYIYTYPLFFGFSSHLGYRLISILASVQQILISYLFYPQKCTYVSGNPPFRVLPFHPPHYRPMSTHFSLPLCFSFCLANRLTYHFSRVHLCTVIYNICFSLADLLHSV